MSELWSSKKISQMKRVIDEVAFQTNILALESAVEAGGNSEDRSERAQSSLQAAWDTAGLIGEFIPNGDSAVESRRGPVILRADAEAGPFAAQAQSLHRALSDLHQLLDSNSIGGANPFGGPAVSPLRDVHASTNLETPVASAATASASTNMFQPQERKRRA